MTLITLILARLSGEVAKISDKAQDVMHELEETQVDREFLLGNTPMRAQPTA